MIPAHFVWLDKLPVSSAGKISRKDLPFPCGSETREYIAPHDRVEKRIVRAMAEVLKKEKVSVTDDFFAIGGNSLHAMELLSALESFKELTPEVLFECRTAEKIALQLKSGKASRLSERKKERLGRAARFPVSKGILWYWDKVNDGSIDLGGAYKLPKEIPLFYLQKRIQKFISRNTLFDLILEKNEKGEICQGCADKSPQVTIEHMTEEQVAELQKNIYRPFGLGESVVRIRLIDTGENRYLFFTVFHMFIDGYALSRMVGRFIRCLQNKHIPKTYYFAWAYDQHQRQKHPVFDINAAYFRNRYSDEDYDFCPKMDKVKDEGLVYCAYRSCPKAPIEQYCKQHGFSLNEFFPAAALVAQSCFNHSDKNRILNTYMNRRKEENPSGAAVHSSPVTFERETMTTPTELIRAMRAESNDNYAHFHVQDSRAHIYNGYDGPNMLLTYLGDWFAAENQEALGEELALEHGNPTNDTSYKFPIIIVKEEKEHMFLIFHVCTKGYRESTAEAFADTLVRAIDQMTEDIIAPI